MRVLRPALLCGAVLVAVAAWSEPTVQLTVDSLTPPGPHTPGQQVTVRGTVSYAELGRPWGGEGILAGKTRHSASVALDSIRTLDDDWPELPELKAAQGELLIADGADWVEFKRTHGGSSEIWSTPVNPPARTQRTDPLNHSDQLPFEATFTVPDECVAIRLRAQLNNTFGANWFVTYYYYDFAPLELDVAGVTSIRVTCERAPYVIVTQTVIVGDDSDRVTVSGTVVDARWQPVHRAMVTATGAGAVGQALTGPEGEYSIELALSDPQVIATRAATGTLKAVSETCDFRLATPIDLITITYQVNAPGYLRKDGKITLRVPMDTKTLWVSGLIGHNDATSVANAQDGYVEPWHRVSGGTIMLQGPAGRNVFEFHWGDFTAYVPIREDGVGAVKTRRIILLDPDPNAATQTAGAAPESLDGFEKQLKVVWEQAPEDLRNLWLRMGLVVALKKDIEAKATGGYSGSSDNVKTYLARWNTGGYRGKMYNALWTLRESLQVLPHPALSTASGMETHAQNAKKYYSQLKGETLATPVPGMGPLQAVVQNIIDKEEAGLSW